jgi:hypothetical protein
MKNVIVLTHLGMGDITCISPAIRYFAAKYENVYIFCKMKYFENCFKLYEDDENINILKLSSLSDHSEYHERMEIGRFVREFKDNYDLLTCGIYKESHNPFNRLPDNFYLDLGLPLDTYEKYFSLPKSVYENQYFDNIITNYEYIFIHGKTSLADYTEKIVSNINSDYLLLCPSKNLYSKNHKHYNIAESVIGLPFFDYFPLIQRSQEIHLISSSFLCLSKFIAPIGIKKYLHNYNNCEVSTNFLKGWTIISDGEK